MPSFEDELSELLAKHADDDLDEIISAMEIQLYALREDQRATDK